MKSLLTVLLFMFMLTLLFISVAEPHENNEYKHMVGDSGPIVSVQSGQFGVTIWSIDNNMDGIIDVCKWVLLIDDIVHVKEVKPINNSCSP